ncbi:MAG: hypothetical protein JWO77_2447 [Ilumatobacteraceae bacterium]|nr:hypothetical protein [Ilumatobacteraceae bacterium]
MAASPSPPLSTDPPSLERIASVIHAATEDDPVARIASIRLDASTETLDLGFWDVPPGPGHPIEPLVGFVAPAEWHAVGLTSSGRLHHLDRPGQEAERALSTVLLGRDGGAASIIGSPGRRTRTLHEPPVGLIPDVLNRVLGRPTPPPDAPTGQFVELTWLDRVATGLLQQRSRVRSWRWLADRHPLRGGGPVPAPEDLAARTAAYSEERTWAGLRSLAVAQELPAARRGPPGGSSAPACTWFDDGSLSRWLLSRLPPAEALVPDLVSVLPHHVGADLLTALGEVDGPWSASSTA